MEGREGRGRRGEEGRVKGERGGGGGKGEEEVIETVVYQCTAAVPLKLLKTLKGSHDSSALAGRDLVGLVLAEL